MLLSAWLAAIPVFLVLFPLHWRCLTLFVVYFFTCESGPEQFVNFSFRSVHFVRMNLQFSSIPYSPTIGHGDRSVRLVGVNEKVHELLGP